MTIDLRCAVCHERIITNPSSHGYVHRSPIGPSHRAVPVENVVHAIDAHAAAVASIESTIDTLTRLVDRVAPNDRVPNWGDVAVLNDVAAKLADAAQTIVDAR